MQYYSFGSQSLPAIMLIHGAGWSHTFMRHAELLKDEYHVIVPVLDGFEARQEERYSSTAQMAEQLLAYVDEYCGGHLFSLCGVSLGGQIVIEMMTKSNMIADTVIIDGVLCNPQLRLVRYGRMIHRGLFQMMTSKVMLQWLNRSMPEPLRLTSEEMDHCVTEMKVFHKESIDALFLSHASYALRQELQQCKIPLLSLVAGKDAGPIHQSAQMLKNTLPDCQIELLPGYRHGELSVHRPAEWVAKARAFWKLHTVA